MNEKITDNIKSRFAKTMIGYETNKNGDAIIKTDGIGDAEIDKNGYFVYIIGGREIWKEGYLDAEPNIDPNDPFWEGLLPKDNIIGNFCAGVFGVYVAAKGMPAYYGFEKHTNKKLPFGTTPSAGIALMWKSKAGNYRNVPIEDVMQSRALHKSYKSFCGMPPEQQQEVVKTAEVNRKLDEEQKETAKKQKELESDSEKAYA